MSARMTQMFAIAALFASSVPALADQCAYIDEEIAYRAAAILATKKKAVTYCEPCGETAPSETIRISDVTKGYTGYEKYWEVLLNGEQIDLAYTFVKTGLTTYTNLAKLAGCPADGVSDSIIPWILRARSKTAPGADEEYGD